MLFKTTPSIAISS